MSRRSYGRRGDESRYRCNRNTHRPVLRVSVLEGRALDRRVLPPILDRENPAIGASVNHGCGDDTRVIGTLARERDPLGDLKVVLEVRPRGDHDDIPIDRGGETGLNGRLVDRNVNRASAGGERQRVAMKAATARCEKRGMRNLKREVDCDDSRHGNSSSQGVMCVPCSWNTTV